MNLSDQPKIREFYLERLEDASGISGTGIVARGVALPSGKMVLEWITNKAPISQAFYDSPEALLEIHGHDGKTLLRWVDKETRPSRIDRSKLGLILAVSFIAGLLIGVLTMMI